MPYFNYIKSNIEIDIINIMVKLSIIKKIIYKYYLYLLI